MRRFSHAEEVVVSINPQRPRFLVRPHEISAAAQCFLEGFPGTVHYAVKCNPNPAVLQTIWDAGVHSFEVASIEEVRLVRQFWKMAKLRFMHPVKYPSDVREAYEIHGIRDFALDHEDELHKIQQATNNADDLSLIVRIRARSDAAVMPLNRKFGIDNSAASSLLKKCRSVAHRVGLTFHVGSQCMDAAAYSNSIQYAARLAEGIDVDILDVGGGFPASYPGMHPAPLQQYFEEIRCATLESSLCNAELWSEPGRAMVASGCSLLVPVLARRNDTLFIGEGTYGSLFDAGSPRFPFPVRLVRQSSAAMGGFRFFGPTCDELDVMEGPFMLPADVLPGDFLEVGQLGAYGESLSTGFNGFERDESVVVSDAAFSDTFRGPVVPNDMPGDPNENEGVML